ncbi:MAG: DNA methyltransferase, partial [Candidatus Hadarchaeum sp.]|uniref:DNA methyltransferase n=1 Tax=Candidatus Hadarchaeum sp. TaxID=2883567 RepID=UPI003D134C9A
AAPPALEGGNCGGRLLKISEKLWLGKLVTPLPDRHRPVYNWFTMKESFSRELVLLLADTWGLAEGDLVLDPFCGTGTTPLACRELGLDCIGYDVHPVLLLAARVKLRDYDAVRLKEEVADFLKQEFAGREAEAPGFVARVFPRAILEEVVSVRQRILELKDEATREFLLLGLATAAMRCSWAHKDGAAIKVAKRLVPPLLPELGRQLRRMCGDIEKFRAKSSRVGVEFCDARRMNLPDDRVDAVITSPPYLGKTEYFSAYRIEQWLMGLEGPRPNDLIGCGESGDFSEIVDLLGDKPQESWSYFQDLFAVIKEIRRVCKMGANICLVVSDGCFSSGPVEVCQTLGLLAERAGLRAKSLVIVNRRYCTTPTRKKLGITREGLLIWNN